MTSGSASSWYRRRRVRFGLAGAVLVLAVAVGPRHRFEPRWDEPVLAPDLADRIAEREAAVLDLRPGDGAEVVWRDPESRTPTPLSLVYLHGFSSDRHEVEPLVSNLADSLGANVYFARLTGHGRDGAAMAEATVEDWLDDTAHAVAVGEAIGERVVLVGTSTGATLAAWASHRPETVGRLAAVVLVSPNFHPKDRSSRLLLYPWGGPLAKLVVGPERCFEPLNEDQADHWTTCYPSSALLPMMALVEHVRTLDPADVHTPTFVLYALEDRVVDAEETTRIVAGMPDGMVQALQFPSSEDPDQHLLAGDIASPGSTDAATRWILDFLREVLSTDGAERHP